MNFKAALIDLDGVLVVGEDAVDGAPEALRKLRMMVPKLRIITNNSTRSRMQLKKHLFELGFQVSEDELITSGSGAASYLRERFGSGRAYIIGEEGLSEELDRAGFDLVADESADFVVVGLDRNLTYKKLEIALNAIRKGARFIATNDDATLPQESGAKPGAGAMVAAVVWSSQKKPEAIIGKPNPYLLEKALKEVGARPEEAILVGDRLETDILGGNDMGMFTVLVMTGASTEQELADANPDCRPKLVLKSIAELPGKIDVI